MYKYLFCFLILFSCSLSSMLGQANRRNIGQNRRTDSTQSISNGQNRRSSTSQSSALDRIFGSSRNTGSSQSSSVGRNNAEQQESPESVAIKLIKHDISLNKYLANPTIYVFRGLPQVPPRGLSEVYDKMLQRLTDEAKELVSSLIAQDITYIEYHKMSKSKREKANLPGEEPILASKIWDNRENYQFGEINSQKTKISETANNEPAEVIENQVPSSSSLSNTDSNGKTISLVVSGEGNTKEEATKNALRSAIEQAFGTFVSANTNVLNDELVKDDIVTITSGNVQKYTEIYYSGENDIKTITVQAEVSIGNLVTYAQSKGMKTELAGATFLMNKKLRDLNELNEKEAYKNLYLQLCLIASNGGLLDYSLKLGEPKELSATQTEFSYELVVTLNQNAKNAIDCMISTANNLKLSPSEIDEYERTNRKFYRIFSGDYSDSNTVLYPLWNQDKNFSIRSEESKSMLWNINTMFEYCYNNGFEFQDNLGNKFDRTNLSNNGISSTLNNGISFTLNEIWLNYESKTPSNKFVGKIIYPNDILEKITSIEIKPKNVSLWSLNRIPEIKIMNSTGTIMGNSNLDDNSLLTAEYSTNENTIYFECEDLSEIVVYNGVQTTESLFSYYGRVASYEIYKKKRDSYQYELFFDGELLDTPDEQRIKLTDEMKEKLANEYNGYGKVQYKFVINTLHRGKLRNSWGMSEFILVN